MDRVFYCVFAFFTIAFWITEAEGTGEALSEVLSEALHKPLSDPQIELTKPISLGIAVRQNEPPSVITQKNSELVLNCSVEYEKDLGPLYMNWTRDGEPVDLSSKRIQILPNGSLFIRRVIHRPKKERSDGGRYQCHATLTEVGTIIAREVQVQVAGIDRKFEIEPKPQRVPLGGVARFQCKIKAVPPAMYFWERNGTLLPQDNNRYLFLSSGILQITGVQKSDVGRYKCYVTQGSLHRLTGIDIDTKYSSEAVLEIDPVLSSNQVKIVASSKNETATVGSSALLECLVQGNNITTEWLKDGKRFTLHDGVERVGNNLLFLQAELEDHGQYQCVAGNNVAAMTLNVIQKPVLLNVTKSRTYTANLWIYLACDVRGSPRPGLKWYKDGKEIDFKAVEYQLVESNKLAITFSGKHISGYYQCIARNEAGFAMGYIRVQISALGSMSSGDGEEVNKPTNVKIMERTKNDIILIWNAPRHSNQSFYIVHYRKTEVIDSENAVVLGTSFHLTELTPFSNYSIIVQLFNGGSADPVVVETLEDVPSQPPTITLIPGKTSIRVRWAALRREIARGNIVGYKLYYRKKGEALAKVLMVPGSVLEYEVTGLEANTMYEVRLNAGTSVGYKLFPDNRWPWVFVQTLDGMYIQLNVESVNATAVNISWLCDRSAQWKQFQLAVRHLVKNVAVSNLTLPGDACNHVITGLEENSIYEVVLEGESLDGKKGQVVEELRTSSEPLPPTPRSLHHTLITTNSVDVTWTQADSDIDIDHFTVRYSQLGVGSKAFGVKTITSDTNSALIQNLLPFSQYKVAVQAHSAHVSSKFSNSLIVWTKAGVPSEPRNVQIKTVKRGQVKVEWLQPAEPNGEIKSYIIMYTTSLEDDTWTKIQKNGTERSAAIAISQKGSADGAMYFRVVASTTEGPGKPSPPVKVNVGQMEPVTGNGPNGDEQTTGIIIGISIGGFCVIICVFIIFCRNRILSHSYSQQPQTQPARFHGNGHIPGNGNGHAVVLTDNNRTLGSYEMDSYTPMVVHLPENEESDSKGGGGGNVILTPNGTKLNGFVPMKKNGMRNGTVQNGHMTSFIHSDYNGEKLDTEETRGLIASMISGGSEQCMTTHVGEESFPTTRYEDLGSLDDIDHSSCEDVLGKSQELSSTGDEQSGAGSISVGDGHSVRYSDSMPRSDTEDKVVMCSEPPECDGLTPILPETGPVPTQPETGPGGNVGGSEEGTIASIIEIPHASTSLRSSSMCEDTYHDGGTADSQHSYADSRLPQLQLTTSTYSQAPVSVVADDDVTRSNSSSTSTLQASLSCANGEPVVDSPGHQVNERVPDMSSSSNGFPPHLCCNLGQPQGDYGINPTIPQSPQPGEASLSHGSRETTLETLAQIPQDAVEAAKANSSPWKRHYEV